MRSEVLATGVAAGSASGATAINKNIFNSATQNSTAERLEEKIKKLIYENGSLK